MVAKLVELGYSEELHTMEDLLADFKECLPFRHALSVMHAMVRERIRYTIPGLSHELTLFCCA